MNGVDPGRQAEAQLSKARLLQELQNLAARKKSIERQLQFLQAKKAAPADAVTQSVVPVDSSVGTKRPGSAAWATADSKRQRLGPIKDAKRPQSPWRTACSQIVSQIKSMKGAEWFAKPVSALKYPSYFQVIKHPMDFQTLSKNLKSGGYTTPQQFRDDMRLIWQNCRTFNAPTDPVGQIGERLSQEFEKRWESIKGVVEGPVPPAQNGPAAVAPATEAEAVAQSLPETMRQLDLEMRQLLQQKQQNATQPCDDASLEGRCRLSVQLSDLPEDRVAGVLELIEDDARRLSHDPNAEVELDLDQLSDDTIRKLWAYVRRVTNTDAPHKLARASQPPAKTIPPPSTQPDIKQQLLGANGPHPPSSQPPSHPAEPQSHPLPDPPTQDSPSSSSAGSGGSSSSDSGSRDGSQAKVDSTGEAPGVGDHPALQPGAHTRTAGNGAATVDVSTTAEQVKHSILKPQSQKQDLSLKNASQWQAVAATAKASSQANGKAAPPDKPQDELWDQFVTREAAKQKEETEERAQQEEEERAVREEEEARQEAKAKELAAEKEQQLERLQAMAGTAKLTNQTDYQLEGAPHTDASMHDALGLKPIAADDEEY